MFRWPGPARRACGSCDSRERLLSVARIYAPGAAAASASALPPAPAQRSRICRRSRVRRPAQSAGCPHPAPRRGRSRNAGWSSIRLSAGRRMPQGLSDVGSLPGTRPAYCRAKSGRHSRAGRAERAPASAGHSSGPTSGDSSGAAMSGTTIARRPLRRPAAAPGPRGWPNSSSKCRIVLRPGPKLPHGRSRAAQPTGELLETPVPGQLADPSILHNAGA